MTGTVGGTANAITLSQPLTADDPGGLVGFFATAANDASTVTLTITNPSGTLAPPTIKSATGADVAIAAIQSGRVLFGWRSGSNFLLPFLL